MSEAHKKHLEKQLWNIADALRSKMNADEYRNYILGFIFFKYLSERMLDFADKQLERAPIKSYTAIPEGTDEGDRYLDVMRTKALKSLGYFLKPSELFSTLVARGTAKAEAVPVDETGTEEEDEDATTADNFILEDLRDVLRHIENSTQGTDSEKDFINLFEDINLNSTKLGRTVKARNKIIVDVLRNLSKIDFKLDEVDADVLGDAYEYLIGEFASGAGKKAGEFYTPQQVSKILARIVTTGKTRLRSVYDPTCGSGSLLLRVAKEAKVDDFYGQEQNPTTYNLCRMNMILHGVHFSKFDIHNDDTLEHPAPHHQDLRAEAVVANPPFSANWSQSQVFMTDDRFSQYGKLAPRTKADFAFVQHMIHHLHENGAMACVLPHGALFRGSSEAHIREYLIKDRNYLDAVIGLPANIFYGTSIPTCILVFKKCREEGENVLFIDASQEFEKEKNQNRLSDEQVDKIIYTYRDRQAIEKYSYVATLEEIAENDYNLNIPRYVDTFEEEEPVDLAEVSAALKRLNVEMEATDQTIAGFCQELGIETPF
ncbi:type I restriction-modification system subunit M [Flavilitoribacter nigricans]|uniref:site-specific DNA-methyltransferase (adenine-specific) n=1 Tax=Flavilitoribacter nigricans (strain ATCC 23147 / DSM 23189 / NBRC 102662 / NCIMB 1420 / SS-2) TaxID=1122177 RepID=A0A2D0NHF3_FLAN2|nr:type I restriction-modification system subunit M [Flavilitoribacter nigricans]PHN07816.1 type I restriction-modification system subunit M [Flavilitoribacter nigricans DSM 23189 = NBRC 102662]